MDIDAAIARLLSTNAAVLTEPPNSQMVGEPEVIQAASNPLNWREIAIALIDRF